MRRCKLAVEFAKPSRGSGGRQRPKGLVHGIEHQRLGRVRDDVQRFDVCAVPGGYFICDRHQWTVAAVQLQNTQQLPATERSRIVGGRPMMNGPRRR